MDATKQAVDATTKKKKVKAIKLGGQSGKAQRSLGGRAAKLRAAEKAAGL